MLSFRSDFEGYCYRTAQPGSVTDESGPAISCPNSPVSAMSECCVWCMSINKFPLYLCTDLFSPLSAVNLSFLHLSVFDQGYTNLHTPQQLETNPLLSLGVSESVVLFFVAFKFLSVTLQYINKPNHIANNWKPILLLSQRSEWTMLYFGWCLLNNYQLRYYICLVGKNIELSVHAVLQCRCRLLQYCVLCSTFTCIHAGHLYLCILVPCPLS